MLPIGKRLPRTVQILSMVRGFSGVERKCPRRADGKKERMIFDSWHFSARKSEERDIYNPLWEMTRKWCPR